MKTVQVYLNSIQKVNSFSHELEQFDNDFDLVSGRYIVDELFKLVRKNTQYILLFSKKQSIKKEITHYNIKFCIFQPKIHQKRLSLQVKMHL